tara:strand:- start:17980 stop:18579 length:600 start_codon:yes stop_codon:yes gene_type:complete
MATKTSIYNMALTHVGAKQLISNLDTDTGTEAKAGRVFWDLALEFVLSDVDWGFARTRVTLALLAETAPVDWTYVYTYPNDCVKAREIFDGARRTRRLRIPFEVSLNADGTLKTIMADQEDAKLRYTRNITDPNLFPPSFSVLMSYYMAYLIAYPLTKKASIRDNQLKDYKAHKLSAEVANAEEEEWDENPEGEFIAGR